MTHYLKCMALAVAIPFAASCSAEEPQTEQQQPFEPSGKTKTIIVYFSAEGHTKAVAEAIREETGSDIFRIEEADEYAANPYDDSDRIQNEAYNDLRPEAKTYLPEKQIAAYDTIFVGTPIWWHQPAMVVCTFLEHYDLSDKVIIPFVTFGARTYLNETMQKLYKSTPNSEHIPAQLPEDVDPDNIRQPQNDDDGIDVPTTRDVREWLERIGYGKGDNSGISSIVYDTRNDIAVYSLSGTRLNAIPENGIYVMNGRKYYSR